MLAMALGEGAYIARRKQYFAHGLIQTSVACLHLVPLFRIMLPSFNRQNRPQLPTGLSDKYDSVALAHAVAGAAAELLGI